MATFVKEYCPNQHVFELMFDLDQYLNCERLIRNGIARENPSTYQFYDSTISENFQNILQKSWDKIQQAVNGANRGTNIVHSSILPGSEIETPVRSDKTIYV